MLKSIFCCLPIPKQPSHKTTESDVLHEFTGIMIAIQETFLKTGTKAGWKGYQIERR